MIGNGKYAFGTSVTCAVGAGAPNPFVAVVVPVLGANGPRNVPVHVAPLGQHATFRALSVVQNEP